MQRTIVQIARMRLADIGVGDIVNGHPDREHGWFRVQVVRRLPSGELIATGAISTETVKGSRWDIVGVQITKQVDVPEPRLESAPDAAGSASQN